MLRTPTFALILSLLTAARAFPARGAPVTAGAASPASPDVALFALLVAVAAAAVALAIVHLWKELRAEALAGPPRRSRLPAASVVAALADIGFLALAARGGLHVRIGQAWFGAVDPWKGAMPLAVPVGLAAVAAAFSAGWSVYRRQSPLFSQQGGSPEEFASRAKLGILLGALGVPTALVSVFAEDGFRGWGFRAATLAGVGLAYAIGHAETVAKRRLARWDDVPDACLLARAQRLGSRMQRPVNQAIITGAKREIKGGQEKDGPDQDGKPKTEISFHRDCLRVSRHAASALSSDEMDYAVAYLLALGSTGAEATGRCLHAASTVGGILMAAYYLLQPRENVPLLMAAGGVYLFLCWAAKTGAAWAHRHADRAVVLRALEATGDLDTAESAIRKMAGGKLQEVAYSEVRAEACIARLREAASQRGMIFARKRPIGR
ncbi:MAG TPA: hypothetical protein VGM37_05355 [Armatimonadota bacterium]|jgi:hypothetical protein